MDAVLSEILLSGALRANAALALAAAAVFAARRSSATLRHRLWALGLAAALALPVLGPLTPQLGVIPVSAQPTLVSAVPMSILAPLVAVTSAPTSAPLEAAPAAPTEPLEIAAPAARPTLGTLLFVAWFAGALLVAAGRGLGLLARWRLRRDAATVTDPAWRELTVQLSRELGRNVRSLRPVSLLCSPAAAVPMTWGTLRPVVLLPAAALGWPEDRRRAVLLHELAHVRRGDAAWLGLAHLACVLHWPNPLVWLAAQRLRAEAEHAADDRVLDRGERPSLYAGHLLAVARAMAFGAAPPQPVLAMAQREGSSSLARRIGAILDRDRARSASRWAAASVVGLALLATVGLAAVGCIRVDGLQYSMSSDVSDAKSVHGYFAAERFAGQCSPGVMSGKGQALQVRGHHDGRQEICLRYQSCDLEVDLRGNIRLDEGSILEMAAGSTFTASEKSGLGIRAVKVTAGSGGTPMLDYQIDGVARPADDEARAFLARVILEIHRSTDLGAEARVARLLASGGSAVVLEEINQISTDYVRAVYLKELIEQTNPRGAELVAVLNATAQLIDSDYEQGQILQAVAKNGAGGEALPAEFFTAVGTIDSDYERSQTLKKALDRSPLTEAELTQALTAARDLDSDYERGQVLRQALARTALPEPTALEVVRSIEALESDYEAGQVLGSLIDKRPLSDGEIEAVIAVVGRIGSDYERAQVLVALAKANKLAGPSLDHFVAAAEAIGSEYERDRTLAAALRNRG